MRRQWVAMATTGMLCALGATANAQLIRFDFEGTTTNPLGDDANATSISEYMTEVYSVHGDHAVAATDALANPSGSDWANTDDRWENDGGFIQAVSGESAFEVSFGDYEITNVRFRGFINEASTGSDFSFAAYGAGYDEDGHSAQNPNSNALVTSDSWEVSQLNNFGKQEDVFFNSGWHFCSEPVYLLVFSGTDVAIDDLWVLTVPLPAAAWMGLMTLGGLGIARRRRRNRL